MRLSFTDSHPDHDSYHPFIMSLETPLQDLRIVPLHCTPSSDPEIEQSQDDVATRHQDHNKQT